MPFRLKSVDREYQRNYRRKHAKRIKIRRERKHLLAIRNGEKRKCKRCGKTKPVSDFHIACHMCKVCHYKAHLKWNESHPILKYRTHRRNHVLKKFGITLDEERSIRKSQNGKCAICKSRKFLGIDHCHKTKRIRKLLCRKCNSGLGFFGDDPTLVLQAWMYLMEHK